MEIKLAKIKNASLNINDHDILTFWIDVEYEDWGSQCIGGITLDTYIKEKGERIGTAFGCEVIRRLLKGLNVNDFSEMKGKMIWVYGIESGCMFDVKGIQPLKVDNNIKPIFWNEIMKEMGL
jgi:hypothetical protein